MTLRVKQGLRWRAGVPRSQSWRDGLPTPAHVVQRSGASTLALRVPSEVGPEARPDAHERERRSSQFRAVDRGCPFSPSELYHELAYKANQIATTPICPCTPAQHRLPLRVRLGIAIEESVTAPLRAVVVGRAERFVDHFMFSPLDEHALERRRRRARYRPQHERPRAPPEFVHLDLRNAVVTVLWPVFRTSPVPASHCRQVRATCTKCSANSSPPLCVGVAHGFGGGWWRRPGWLRERCRAHGIGATSPAVHSV